MSASNTKLITIGLVLCLALICLTYCRTLNRPWLFYDENVILEELTVPKVTSFSEVIETIKSFGTGYGFSSGNFLYSSNSVYRFIQCGAPFLLLINFLLNKSSFGFHCLNLFLHLVNTVMVCLILRKIISKKSAFHYFLLLSLTLLWALHPAHVESILLSSNIGATFAYFFFFVIFYDFINNKDKKYSTARKITIPLVYFLITITLHEYVVVLPLITLAYSMIENYKTNSLKDSITKSVQQNIPYFDGFFLYIIYFFISGYKFHQTLDTNSISLILERIFWLAPQILFHFIKIIFYPNILTIDQSAHIKFGHSIFDSYPLFCFSLILVSLLFIASYFTGKKKLYSISLTTTLLVISLLPFSQIFSPTYCLAAERYLYIPIFFLIFGIAHIINDFRMESEKLKTITMVLISLLLSLYLIRTCIRTNDWKNDETFLKAAIKTSSNYLYKGFRFNDLANISTNNQQKEQYIKISEEYYDKAYKELKQEQPTDEPKILTAYGLDNNSLLIKSVYLMCFRRFINNPETYQICLEKFQPYIKYLEQFDPNILELYANLLAKKGDLPNAKTVFLYAYKKYPTCPFILVSLILFERDIENNQTNAKKYIAEARKLYPYSKDILLEELKYYRVTNNLPEYARIAYLYGLRIHSKFSYFEALTGFLTIGQLDNAKKTIDKLIILDKLDPKIYYFASNYYMKKRNLEEAINSLHKAHELVNRNNQDLQLAFDITNSLAHMYAQLGNLKSVTQYAEEALNLAQGNENNTIKIKSLMKELGI